MNRVRVYKRNGWWYVDDAGLRLPTAWPTLKGAYKIALRTASHHALTEKGTLAYLQWEKSKGKSVPQTRVMNVDGLVFTSWRA